MPLNLARPIFLVIAQVDFGQQVVACFGTVELDVIGENRKAVGSCKSATSYKKNRYQFAHEDSWIKNRHECLFH
jgi:hypothetical protein